MIDPKAIVKRWHELRSDPRRRWVDEHEDYIRLASQTWARLWDRSGVPVPWPPWCEIGAVQLPNDLLMFGEALHQTKPTVLIETGTLAGASAAIWAEQMRRIVGDAFQKLITIELIPEHVHARYIDSDPRIVSLIGDSTTPEMLARVRELIPEGARVMVTLDSAHDGLCVSKEIANFAPLVTPGCYLVVQDGYLGLCWGGNILPQDCHATVERGDFRAFNPENCPLGAVQALLDTSDDFEIDLTKQRFILTQHPFGWLKRKERT